MFNWSISNDPMGGVEVKIKWDFGDLVDIDFTPFDYVLLRECEKSPSIADKLLAIELIARKLEALAGNTPIAPPAEREG